MLKTLTPILAICAAVAMTAPMTAFAADKAACEKSAADKKLAGAAKNSHIKKCMGEGAAASSDAKAMCDKSAADKKLAGAAKNSHVKKCMADAAGEKKS